MKKLVFVSLVTFIAVCTYGQDIDQKNVPAVILNAFQLEYANADDVDWELKEGNYQVEFELNNKDHRVLLDNKGKILKHRQELWESEIPIALIETVRSKCKYFDLDNAVVNEEGGKAVYYISFEVNNRDCKFWMDERGRLLLYRQELRESDIPAGIQTAIKNQYASFDFDDGELTEEDGKATYYVDGEVDDKDHFFWFDGKGKLLKHSQVWGSLMVK